MPEQLDHIAQFLKENDPDRYFASLILPKSCADDVRALYAFSAEIALTRQRITEPATGEIRLQYWVDMLSGTEHGQTQSNPIAQSLFRTIDKYDLPTGPLRRLLAARRFDLYDDPMADTTAFEGYAGETNSILYQLATLIINGGNDVGGAEAAGHMGVAHALIGHLQAMPLTASRGQIYLPWAVFTANGVKESDFFAGETTPELINACTQLREIVAKHLALTKTEIHKLDKKTRPIFANISVLEKQLHNLTMMANTPFKSAKNIQDWQKIAKIVWWSIKN